MQIAHGHLDLVEQGTNQHMVFEKVEYTLMFSSEFFSTVEMTEGLRYKLWMMGIEINGLTNVFCDNESVVTNTMRPKSTFKKKHNVIAYHCMCEAQAMGIVRIAHEDGEMNLSNMLTKNLPGPRLHELISYILY